MSYYRDSVFNLIFSDRSTNFTETTSKLMSNSGNEFSFDATKADIWSLVLISIDKNVKTLI
jgi:hypothetical protein